jgi:pyroglutamyl-peptidase
MVPVPHSAIRRTGGRSATAKCAIDGPCVLLTGFDAFGGANLNPSWLLALGLHGRQVGGHRIVAAQLPTVFGTSLSVLDGLLEQHRPVLVVCLGQAAGRSAISLERVAINVDDARIADNAGAQPVDDPVVAAAPAAYFSSLPIKAMWLGLRKAGIAAEVSQSAGTFVCNHVFFGLAHRLAAKRRRRPATSTGSAPGGAQAVGLAPRGGFIHVPWPVDDVLADQPRASRLDLQTMVDAIRIALVVTLTTAQDPKLPGGALD